MRVTRQKKPCGNWSKTFFGKTNALELDGENNFDAAKEFGRDWAQVRTGWLEKSAFWIGYFWLSEQCHFPLWMGPTWARVQFLAIFSVQFRRPPKAIIFGGCQFALSMQVNQAWHYCGLFASGTPCLANSPREFCRWTLLLVWPQITSGTAPSPPQIPNFKCSYCKPQTRSHFINGSSERGSRKSSIV